MNRKKKHRAMLREQIANAFNMDGLRTLAYDLDINFDDLQEGNIQTRITSLILYLCHHKRLGELKSYLIEKRQNWNWDEIKWSAICETVKDNSQSDLSRIERKSLDHKKVLSDLAEAFQSLASDVRKFSKDFYPRRPIHIIAFGGITDDCNLLIEQLVEWMGEYSDNSKIPTLNHAISACHNRMHLAEDSVADASSRITHQVIQVKHPLEQFALALERLQESLLR